MKVVDPDEPIVEKIMHVKTNKIKLVDVNFHTERALVVAVETEGDVAS
jgi:hypothetical protein